MLASCGPPLPPPPNRVFDGLPVTGVPAFAETLGFTPCFDTSDSLRCRKDAVMVMGIGPFRAAVDVRDGRSGFDQLTVWNDGNQDALFAVSKRLEQLGWQVCRTGQEDRGDQAIWTRAGAQIRFSMDLSYWGKRRLRLLPELGQPTGRCW
nr:hypothetical protein [Sphingomonas japonica]